LHLPQSAPFAEIQERGDAAKIDVQSRLNEKAGQTEFPRRELERRIPHMKKRIITFLALSSNHSRFIKIQRVKNPGCHPFRWMSLPMVTMEGGRS